MQSLRKVYLFANLTPQEMKFLAGVVRKREFRAGSTVFREGDPAISLFIVESGSLRVVKANPNGGEPVVLSTLQTGVLFGEIPFVAGGARTANIMALEFASAYEIAYDQMEQLTQVNPQFGTKLYKSLASYLAKCLKQTTALVAEPKPEVKVAARTRTGNTGFIQRPAPAGAPPGIAPVAGAGPTHEAPGVRTNASGEIVIEIDE